MGGSCVTISAAEDFGLGILSGALLQALAVLSFQLTLPPLKQGIFPGRKREPTRVSAGLGESHIIRVTGIPEATKSDPEKWNELGGHFRKEKRDESIFLVIF